MQENALRQLGHCSKQFAGHSSGPVPELGMSGSGPVPLLVLTVCYSMLQYVTVCYSILQYLTVSYSKVLNFTEFFF